MTDHPVVRPRFVTDGDYFAARNNERCRALEDGFCLVHKRHCARPPTPDPYEGFRHAMVTFGGAATSSPAEILGVLGRAFGKFSYLTQKMLDDFGIPPDEWITDPGPDDPAWEYR